MNIFVITSVENLKVFKTKLSEKYPSIQIQGTNDLLEGIDSVMKHHIYEEYDLFLILNQRFVEEDLESRQQLSSKFNKACVYALKDLPIYFLCKESNKKLQESIKSSLTGTNVKIYPYKKLQVSVVEDIIKEVLVHTETKTVDMSSVRKDVVNAKRAKEQQKKETSVDRIFNQRKQQDKEDFTKLSRITSIINKYSTKSHDFAKVEDSIDKSAEILSELKTKLFSNAGDIPAQGDIKIKNLNHQTLSEKISPQKLKADLMSSNQQYSDYANYMELLKDVIEGIQKSDEPNKHELIFELLQEKAKTNTEAYQLLSEFTSEIVKSSIDFVADEYKKDINELHEFGKLQDVDNLIGGEMHAIQTLKQQRESMKVQARVMIEGLTQITSVVNKQLTQTGNLFLEDAKAIESEILEYANENNLPIDNVSLPSKKPIITSLNENYTGVKNLTNTLSLSAQNTVKHLMSILVTDDAIIDKQDNVIDTLLTQKTKKVITVDNLLQTKLCAIAGLNGVGKTHTAVNMAYCHSKLHKTLLIDMNIFNPSLHFYNNKTDNSVTRAGWTNAQTISLEEFIRIPIGKYMHEQIPFKDNLTVIQPLDEIDLNLYERTVNPSVFSLHIKGFLDELAHFYDKIIMILPEDLSQLEDMLPFIGALYLVNDYNPSNFKRLNFLTSKYDDYFRKIPVKHFIINKHNRSIRMTPNEYLHACNIDTKEYKYTIVSEFKNSTQDKLDGNVPVSSNVNTRQIFDELIKR